MAMTLSAAHREQLALLRIEPVVKHVRAFLGGDTVIDSRRALLVWEPNRIVPTYAVPRGDITGTLADDDSTPPDPPNAAWPVWDPRVPFGVRTTPGRPVRITRPSGGLTAAGFLADDPDLDGYVILDFPGFTAWWEDEDEIVSHPHDPFARIDIRQTALHLQLAVDGVTIADTTRAKALYETYLPVRYYLPRDDVTVDLQPSSTVTWCSYKGRATYLSPVVNGTAHTNLAWTYEDPLVDALDVAHYLAFFDEKVDVTIDGVTRPRPLTAWS